jgi:two-component sensor histidine kinase
MEITTAVIVNVGLLALLSGLFYFGYRSNRSANRRLQLTREKITKQNLTLKLLLNQKHQLGEDKDTLSKEKQQLLREVLHRVNNNLQIVLSLVNTQAYYLKEGPALDAIRESQNRVQSISLIHQKLYTGPDISSVSMLTYAGALIEHLRNSYGEKTKRIAFEYHVEDIRINVNQAIPIGLILNETITNAIRYAFPQHNGRIEVFLNRVGPDRLLLKINDNGIGLAHLPAFQHMDMPGWQMIRALGRQLDGWLSVETPSGVAISILFPYQHNGIADRETSSPVS